MLLDPHHLLVRSPDLHQPHWSFPPVHQRSRCSWVGLACPPRSAAGTSPFAFVFTMCCGQPGHFISQCSLCSKEPHSASVASLSSPSGPILVSVLIDSGAILLTPLL